VTYQIKIRKQALKELAELPLNANQKIVKAIESLSTYPRPSGSKKLKGEKEYLWRIRVGDYRVIYQIEEIIRVVEVRKIGHRKEVYD